MATTFMQLGLPRDLVAALERRHIVEPFPVQAATIPDVLRGRDVLGRAPTGSGKTLAYGLPLVATVDRADRKRPSALVLAPTRELAEQINRELSPLAAVRQRTVAAIYGGVAYGPQISALRRGVDVLVATPGRLEDLMSTGAVDLGGVAVAVVDEADRMADMGFLPAVQRILDQTPSDRQTLLFSATLDGDVAVLTRRYQKDPVRHETGATGDDVGDDITMARHVFWRVDRADRPRHTAAVVEAAGSTLVFTRTRHGADRLRKQLEALGVSAVALHGGRTQGQRSRALETFVSGRAAALVATDVAARGIHIDAVAAVVHFDVPAEDKDYVHRSGRTARAGAAGVVVSLVGEDQQRSVARMQRRLGLDGPIARPRIDDLLSGEQQPAGAGSAATTSIYVANLPWSATADDVQAVFSRFGTVHQATIVADRRTGRSRGFGFVEMARPGAQAAIEELHGSALGGRDLTVKHARPNRPR